MMFTYDKLGRNGRFGNQLFQIASTIGMARSFNYDYGFPNWEYQKFFVNKLPHATSSAESLHGYLQDYKLFRGCEEEIRELFKMKYPPIDMTDYVFIHFRAYGTEGVERYHPEQTKEYYEKAVEHFPGKKFIVFSDDLEKAKKILPSNFIFHSDEEMKDFYMMTQCDGAIISNSTFSWWAAWLQNKKTVMPLNWFTDKVVYDSSGLYIPNWIAI